VDNRTRKILPGTRSVTSSSGSRSFGGKGTGSILDRENQASISRRRSNLSLSGAHRSKAMREHAQYFLFFRGERKNRGLAGGETVHTNSRAPFTDQNSPPANAARRSIPTTAQALAARDGAVTARQVA